MKSKSNHGLLRLLWLFLKKDNEAIYDYGMDLFSHLLPGSRFMNYGMWDRPLEEIAPSQRLCEYLLEQAQLLPSHHVLHVGCGLGEQDILCYEKYQTEKIVGLNINHQQVELTRSYVQQKGYAAHISYCVGDATAMPAEIQPEFHRVLALECLDELPSRLRFFQEAHRVLLSNGLLVMVDSYLRGKPKTREEFEAIRVCADFWGARYPFYNQEDYDHDLAQAGFVQTQVIPIREHVFKPLIAYLQNNPHKLEAVRREYGYPRLYIRQIQKQVETAARALENDIFEYAVVRAQKP